MVKPLVLVPPVLFAAFAGLFLGGMFRQDPDALPSARMGQEAPALALTPLGDKPGFTDATLDAGGVKLVNFWASWCAPCRAEHPVLERMAAEGIPIYGVNYKDDPEKALGFLAELGSPYRAIGADAGRSAIDWGVYGVPETFVIDGRGKILMRFPGPITPEILDGTIRPAMAKAAQGG